MSAIDSWLAALAPLRAKRKLLGPVLVVSYCTDPDNSPSSTLLGVFAYTDRAYAEAVVAAYCAATDIPVSCVSYTHCYGGHLMERPRSL